MKAQIKLGRIFGIEIGLHYSLGDHRAVDHTLSGPTLSDEQPSME